MFSPARGHAPGTARAHPPRATGSLLQQSYYGKARREEADSATLRGKSGALYPLSPSGIRGSSARFSGRRSPSPAEKGPEDPEVKRLTDRLYMVAHVDLVVLLVVVVDMVVKPQ